jgi:hypothetical protein
MIFSVTLALVGCTERRNLLPVLEEGYLQLPDGDRLPLGESDDSLRPGWSRETTYRADGRMITVRLPLAFQGPGSGRPLLVDLHGWAVAEAAIVAEDAYFQADDGPREPIVALGAENSSIPNPVGNIPPASHHRLNFEVPKKIAALSTSANNPDSEYTLHLPFLLDDSRWVHHMRFRIKVQSRWYFGAPATP